MRIDLAEEDSQGRTSMVTLPQFILADRLRHRLLVLMTFLIVSGLLLWIVAATSTNSMGRVVLADTAAALLLLEAALQSGYWVARWRAAAFSPGDSAKARRPPRNASLTADALNAYSARLDEATAILTGCESVGVDHDIESFAP